MTAARLLASLAGPLALTGCVVISTGSNKSTSGQFVGTETLEQIEPGANKQYVLAVLGDPSIQTTVDEITEIWRWRYRESRSSRSCVFLLIHDNRSSEQEHSTYVQFENGVVAGTWRD